MNKIDIILMTCNRLDFTKKCIEELTTRIIPFSKVNLIVTDDKSSDGTFEFLEEMVEKKIVSVLLNNNGKGYSGISVAWDDGLKYVSSEYFITTFDDIIIPFLKPDVVDQLISLMEKYPEYGGISCRIQRIPNMSWLDADITTARKGLASYFRIQRLEDILKAGGFGKKHYEEFGFTSLIRKIGKEAGWASNLWCNHLGYGNNRGYKIKTEKHGSGTWKRNQAVKEKPYPKIDLITNKPLDGERVFK